MNKYVIMMIHEVTKAIDSYEVENTEAFVAEICNRNNNSNSEYYYSYRQI